MKAINRIATVYKWNHYCYLLLIAQNKTSLRSEKDNNPDWIIDLFLFLFLFVWLVCFFSFFPILNVYEVLWLKCPSKAGLLIACTLKHMPEDWNYIEKAEWIK